MMNINPTLNLEYTYDKNTFKKEDNQFYNKEKLLNEIITNLLLISEKNIEITLKVLDTNKKNDIDYINFNKGYVIIYSKMKEIGAKKIINNISIDSLDQALKKSFEELFQLNKEDLILNKDNEIIDVNISRENKNILEGYIYGLNNIFRLCFSDKMDEVILEMEDSLNIYKDKGII